MNNKEIIRNILIEELSKCNNFNYYVKIGNLKIIVNAKKHYQILIDNSFYFEGGINSKWIFESHKIKYLKIKYLYLSYDNIWSKFEKEIKLKYLEIQSIVKDVLEEGFKLKSITPIALSHVAFPGLEEGLKIKGITPASFGFDSINKLEEGFKLKSITPIHYRK